MRKRKHWGFDKNREKEGTKRGFDEKKKALRACHPHLQPRIAASALTDTDDTLLVKKTLTFAEAGVIYRWSL